MSIVGLKAFKSEWSTVKGEDLWVGGLGKEWTTQDGEVLNTHPMFVKKINRLVHQDKSNI